MPWTYDHLKPKGIPDLLSDEVPWRAAVDEGVIAQKQGHALQRSYLSGDPIWPTRVTKSRAPRCYKPMKSLSAWVGNGCSTVRRSARGCWPYRPYVDPPDSAPD